MGDWVIRRLHLELPNHPIFQSPNFPISKPLVPATADHYNASIVPASAEVRAEDRSKLSSQIPRDSDHRLRRAKGVVEALLAAGAQPDAPELTHAFLNGMMSQLRSQLPAEAKAAIPEKPSPRTPITCAAEQGHEDIAEMLRKYLAEHPAKKKQRPAA